MNKDVPTSVWQGSFTLFGVEVKCHVLNNGKRIIESESMHSLLEAMGRDGAVLEESELNSFAKWQRGIE